MNKRFEQLKSFSDIVDAMIRGLKKEWVPINMNTFGDMHVDRFSNRTICWGCAATNTLCELMGKAFEPKNLPGLSSRADEFNFDIESGELNTFEWAIDELRKGHIYGCYKYLMCIPQLFGFQLPSWGTLEPVDEGIYLPRLEDENYKADLVHYEQYRDWLREKGL